MNEILVQITPILVSVISALATYVMVALKVRTTSIAKKIDKIELDKLKEIGVDFSTFDVFYRGTLVDVHDITAKKKEVLKNVSQKNKQE